MCFTEGHLCVGGGAEGGRLGCKDAKSTAVPLGLRCLAMADCRRVMDQLDKLEFAKLQKDYLLLYIEREHT